MKKELRHTPLADFVGPKTAKIGKNEFAELCEVNDVAPHFNLENLPNLIRFALTLRGEDGRRRPSLDTVRNWCRFDFTGNSDDACQIRLNRGRTRIA
jgi:hypothetical protein